MSETLGEKSEKEAPVMDVEQREARKVDVLMKGQRQETSAKVPEASMPEKATQAEETRPRWGWVEAAVWTRRMLAALENGVKGGTWFSLVDKVYSRSNLERAFAKVKANRGGSGVDHVSVEEFGRHLDENLTKLQQQLKDGTYRPQAIRRVWIPKPGSRTEKRPLGIPTVRDRVAQTALRNVLEPIFENEFADHSYGFRPERGCKDALRRVVELLRRGYTHVVDADLKSYFDTIPKDRLQQLVADKVADSRVLALIEGYLNQPVMEELKSWIPEEGTPQGAVISPLLANIYLNPLDHEMEGRGYEMVRYADDLVILCRSRDEAEAALEALKSWTAATGLTLHPEKTRIVNASERGGFDFLGYHFERDYRWPRKKSLQKLKDSLRVKTRRTSGISLKVIIENCNRTLRGWFAYFKHSHQTTFLPLDKWLRMRLRSILRKRSKRKGRGRGRDHQRWPNAYFSKQGLFSLVAARAALSQPTRG